MLKFDRSADGFSKANCCRAEAKIPFVLQWQLYKPRFPFDPAFWRPVPNGTGLVRGKKQDDERRRYRHSAGCPKQFDLVHKSRHFKAGRTARGAELCKILEIGYPRRQMGKSEPANTKTQISKSIGL